MAKNSIVNGKKFEDLINELKKEVDAKYINDDQWKTINIAAFRKRMIEVFGISNIDIADGPDVNVTPLKNRFLIQGTVQITIKDDSDCVIKQVRGVGAAMVSPGRESGEFTNLSSSVQSVQSAAFKKACQYLNIFSLFEEEIEEASNKSTPNRELITLHADSTLQLWNNKKEDQRNYILHNVTDDNNNSYEVIFWHKEISKCPNWESFLEHSKADKYAFSIYVKRQLYRGVEQLIFQGFA